MRPLRLEQPWLGLLVCLASLWRFAVLGQRTPVLVHDNLDSSVVWQKLVADSGQLFGADDALIANIMGGMPRGYFDSELNVFSLLNAALTPFHAYVANAVAMVGTAYLGMWLLIRNHLVKTAGSSGLLIAAGVALGFALLPHWPGGGLSVAGTPLLLNTFLDLRRADALSWRREALAWGVICLFPFYSSVILCFAVYLIFGVLLLVDLARRTWSWRPLIAVCLLTVAYAVVEHRLVKMTLGGGSAVSHRIEFERKMASLGQGARDALTIFERGHYHAPSLHTHVLLPVVCLGLLLGSRLGKASVRLWIIFAGLVLTSVIYGGLNLAALEPLRDSIALLRSFNFGRVHWMQPLLWYAGFAVALDLLQRRLAFAAGWLALPLMLQAGYVLWQAPKERSIGGRSLPFSAFYAPELFGQIQAFIGLPLDSYRVVSVGMHPAVALYNGFYTLDGYLANYPLSYKRQFRPIIAPELAKNATMRAYFDRWGSRAYVFSSDLWKGCGSLCTKELPAEVQELKLHTGALFEQGGRYVLSAVPIVEADGLQFLRRFESSEAAWSVSVYAVMPAVAFAANEGQTRAPHTAHGIALGSPKYFLDDQPK
jgi:Protein of unknown function (DUF6044)